MVLAEDAREDVEELLTKELVYIRKIGDLVDLSSDEKSLKDEEINIPVQITFQNYNQRQTFMGSSKITAIVGLFRYEYCFDINGRLLKPKLIPKRNDYIKFLSRKLQIKECTPATSEDDLVIAWDFTAEEV